MPRDDHDGLIRSSPIYGRRSLMITRGVHAFAQVELHDCKIEDGGVVEIPLLLPHWQAEALECVAHDQGLTAGHAHIVRAVSLDDCDPWGQIALGYLSMMERRTEESLAAFRRAVNLNPSSAAAHGYLSHGLAFAGEGRATAGGAQWIAGGSRRINDAL